MPWLAFTFVVCVLAPFVDERIVESFVVVWFWGLLCYSLRKREGWPLSSTSDKWVLGLVVALLASCYLAVWVSFPERSSGQLILGPLVYFCVRLMCPKPNPLRLVLPWFIALAGAIQSIFAIVDFWYFLAPYGRWQDVGASFHEPVFRATGSFDDPILFALFEGAAVVSALCMVIEYARRESRIWPMTCAAIALSLSTLGLFLSATRGPTIALVLVLLLILVVSAPSRRALGVVIASVGIAVTCLLLLFPQPLVVTRILLAAEDFSLLTRRELLLALLPHLFVVPPFGLGPGPENVIPYLATRLPTSLEIFGTYSFFLELYFQAGIVATSLFVCFLYSVFRCVPPLSPDSFTRAPLMVVVWFLLCGLADTLFRRSLIIVLFWMMLACVVENKSRSRFSETQGDI